MPKWMLIIHAGPVRGGGGHEFVYCIQDLRGD